MKKIITATLFLFVTSNIWASSLSISKEFEFLAVNGKKVENGLFSKTTRLTLSSGPQKIALLYKSAVRDDIGNGSTRVASQPLILSLVAHDDEHYKLMTSFKIKRLSDAKAFIKDPQIKVINARGEPAKYSMYQAKTEDHGIVGNVIKKRETNRQSMALLATETETANEGNKNKAKEMLLQWWEKADSETQKQFVSWAIKQIN